MSQQPECVQIPDTTSGRGLEIETKGAHQISTNHQTTTILITTTPQ